MLKDLSILSRKKVAFLVCCIVSTFLLLFGIRFIFQSLAGSTVAAGSLTPRGKEYVVSQVAKGSTAWNVNLLVSPAPGLKKQGGTTIETACGSFIFPFPYTQPSTTQTARECSFQARVLDPFADGTVTIKSSTSSLDEESGVQLRKSQSAIYTQHPMERGNFDALFVFESKDSVSLFAKQKDVLLVVSLSGLSSVRPTVYDGIQSLMSSFSVHEKSL